MRSQLQRARVGVCSALVFPAVLVAATAVVVLTLGRHSFEGKTSHQWASAVRSGAAAFPRLLPSSAAKLTTNPLLPAPASRQAINLRNQNSDRWKPATGFAGLPPEAQSSISRLLGRELPGYQARAQGDGLATENARHKLAADFTPAGVELRSGNALWKLALRSYDYGDALQLVSAAFPRASSNRVE